MTTITTPPTETAEVSLPSARIYPSLRAAWVPLLALALAFFVEMVDNTLLSEEQQLEKALALAKEKIGA